MSRVQTHAGSKLALPFGLALVGAPAAHAAIGFDAASRAATTTTGRTSLSWSHTVGGGADRVLVVGVAAEDASTADANITSVTYRGVALTAVPNSKRSGGGTGIIQTQLFYLLNAGPGRRRVAHRQRHDAGRGRRHLRRRRLADGREPGRSPVGGDQRRHERRRLHLDQHHERRRQLVDRGRRGKRQLRLLHAVERTDRARGTSRPAA